MGTLLYSQAWIKSTGANTHRSHRTKPLHHRQYRTRRKHGGSEGNPVIQAQRKRHPEFEALDTRNETRMARLSAAFAHLTGNGAGIDPWDSEKADNPREARTVQGRKRH